MGKTGISWCDEVWNPVVGCSAACDYCYARELHDRRYQARLNGWSTAPAQYLFPFSQVQLFPERLAIPLKRKKPTTFFVNSVSDLFDHGVSDDFRDRIYAVMALCPQHTFVVLTKQAERLAGYWSAPRTELGLRWWKAGQHPTELKRLSGQNCGRYPETGLPNVWHGVSIEDQAAAAERIPCLLRVPGKRFLSIEPMLGPVDLRGAFGRWKNIHADEFSGTKGEWEYQGEIIHHLHSVILGGESGKNARPLHPDWVRSVRDQCAKARVPFMFKQWGEWIGTPTVFDSPPEVNNYPLTTIGMKSFSRVGKKKAGRTLDGVIHDALPWKVAVKC